MNQYLLGIFFAHGSHFAGWWEVGIAHTLNAVFFGWVQEEQEGWTKGPGISEAFVIIETTYWFTKFNGFALKQQTPAAGPGRAAIWRTQARTYSLCLVCLSILKVVQLWELVSFLSLDLEWSTNLQILSKSVMDGCWEIQIASSAGANRVMSHYGMRSQRRGLTRYVHCILSAWGTAKGWVHWRNAEVLLLNPLASKSSTTPAWLGIPLRTPLGIAPHSTKY